MQKTVEQTTYLFVLFLAQVLEYVERFLVSKAKGAAHVVVFVDAAVVVQERGSVAGVCQEFVCETCFNSVQCQYTTNVQHSVDSMPSHTGMGEVMHDRCQKQGKLFKRRKVPPLTLCGTQHHRHGLGDVSGVDRVVVRVFAAVPLLDSPHVEIKGCTINLPAILCRM